MLKSQQQVSANQGRLDAFMSQSQPRTAAPAVPSTATAGPTAITCAPAAASHASTAVAAPTTAVAAPTTAAATSGTTSGRPSWVKARPDQRSNRGIVAPDSAARPRDITNLPLSVGASPSKGQAKQPMPNTVSPGKQTTMQSFFQPKQVLQPQHSHQQQQQRQQQQQQQQLQQQQQQGSSFGNLQTSAGASGNMFQPQGTMQSAPQQQGMPTRQARPQQGGQSWQQQQQQQQQWQQQQQQQMLAQAAPKPAVKVSGVFADDDDFDDIWMSDQAFQAPATKPAHNRALPGAGHSIQARPVIDLAGSPAHKKPRTFGS